VTLAASILRETDGTYTAAAVYRNILGVWLERPVEREVEVLQRLPPAAERLPPRRGGPGRCSGSIP
jgi:hypothetical protein